MFICSVVFCASSDQSCLFHFGVHGSDVVIINCQNYMIVPMMILITVKMHDATAKVVHTLCRLVLLFFVLSLIFLHGNLEIKKNKVLSALAFLDENTSIISTAADRS